MTLKIVPLTLAEANKLVRQLHRHHKPVVGHRFSIGVECDDKLVGAAIVGRPVARLTAPTVAEVTRCVTDGTPNACSFLYSAAARVAREMGFDSIQTFTLESESGVSLRAAGWERVGTSPGGQWKQTSLKQMRLDTSTGGANRDDQPTEPKQKWRKVFRRRGVD